MAFGELAVCPGALWEKILRKGVSRPELLNWTVGDVAQTGRLLCRGLAIRRARPRGYRQFVGKLPRLQSLGFVPGHT